MSADKWSKLLGRDAANEAFTRIVEQPALSPTYLLVSGVFGVGKSVLLEHWIRICKTRNIPHVYISIGGASLGEIAGTLLSELPGRTPTTFPRQVQQTTETESYFDLPLFSDGVTRSARNSAKISDSDRLQQFAHSLAAWADGSKYILLVDISTPRIGIVESLRKMLFAHFDANAVIVIACRSLRLILPLLEQEIIEVIHIERLSNSESLHLLKSLGMKDDSLASELVGYCAGNPYLLAEGANAFLAGQTAYQTIIPILARSGIRRALTEVAEKAIRDLVPLAGVARWFNLEILRRITGSQRVDIAYAALSDLSFFSDVNGGLEVDSLLERLLLTDWISSSPKRYEELNTKVLRYYRTFVSCDYSARPTHFVTEQIFHEFQASRIGAVEFIADVALTEASLRDLEALSAVSLEVHSLPWSQAEFLTWGVIFKAIHCRLTLQWATAQTLLAAQLAIEHTTSATLGWLYLELAQCQLSSGNWQLAEETVRQSNHIFNAQRSVAGSFFSNLCLAHSLLYQRKINLAEKALNAAKSVIIDVNSYEPYVKTIHIWLLEAEICRFRGQWDSAHEALRLAGAAAARITSRHLDAQASNLLGKLHRSRQEWPLAIRSFDRAIQLTASSGDYMIAAQAQQSLGSIYIKQMNFDAALTALASSMETKQQYADWYGIGKTLNSLAHIKRASGDFAGSIAQYAESLECFNRIENWHKASRVLCRMGMAYFERGDLEEAETKLQESRAIRVSISDTQGIAECDFELGRIAERRKQLLEANRYYSASLDYAVASGSTTRMMHPLVYLAALALRNRELEKGYSYLRKARKLADENRLYSFLVQAYIVRAKQDLADTLYDLGFMLLTEAVYIGAHEDDAVARNALAVFWTLLTSTFSQQEFSSALDSYCRRSLAYWSKHCRDTQLDSVLLGQLTSFDATEAAKQAGGSAQFIEQLLRAVHSFP